MVWEAFMHACTIELDHEYQPTFGCGPGGVGRLKSRSLSTLRAVSDAPAGIANAGSS